MTKALVIVTNHTEFGEANAAPTGLWLSELTHFYDEFEKAGYAMDIVSPKGGAVPIDGRSLKWPMLDGRTKQRYEDATFMALLENTPALSSVDWRNYDALYFAGGHGAMWDFANNAELQAPSRDMYEAGRLVSAVCHGVAALQNVRLSDGSYLIDGKKGTGFPYRDEAIAGVKKLVPYNLEENLRAKGMHYSRAFLPLRKHVVVDGMLVTGQNPNSATKTAQRALEALGAR